MNRSLKRHMDSGSRCPIYLIRCLGYMVNRAAAPEEKMTHDSTDVWMDKKKSSEYDNFIYPSCCKVNKSLNWSSVPVSLFVEIK